MTPFMEGHAALLARAVGRAKVRELGRGYLSLPRDVQHANDNRRESPARGRPGQTCSAPFHSCISL